MTVCAALHTEIGGKDRNRWRSLDDQDLKDRFITFVDSQECSQDLATLAVLAIAWTAVMSNIAVKTDPIMHRSYSCGFEISDQEGSHLFQSLQEMRLVHHI